MKTENCPKCNNYRKVIYDDAETIRGKLLRLQEKHGALVEAVNDAIEEWENNAKGSIPLPDCECGMCCLKRMVKQ
jgi:hypothetical protein